MVLKKGDKLRCLQTLNNMFGFPLYVKDQIYEVLFVYNDDHIEISPANVALNHNLIGNEYGEFPLEFINKYFVSLKQERKIKLEKLNETY